MLTIGMAVEISSRLTGGAVRSRADKDSVLLCSLFDLYWFAIRGSSGLCTTLLTFHCAFRIDQNSRMVWLIVLRAALRSCSRILRGLRWPDKWSPSHEQACRVHIVYAMCCASLLCFGTRCVRRPWLVHSECRPAVAQQILLMSRPHLVSLSQVHARSFRYIPA
jgi:hypothetical protein